MGAGFPTRPSRRVFGPTMKNAGDVINAETDVGAELFNLSWWQVAGLGVAGALAFVHVSSAGALVSTGQAWNPNGDVSLNPAVARTGAGVYTVTFETLYDDESGVEQPLTLTCATVSVRSSTANIVGVWDVALVAGTWVFTVKTTTANTGAAVDAAFTLEVR
jgi:hypothetical protein